MKWLFKVFSFLLKLFLILKKKKKKKVFDKNKYKKLLAIMESSNSYIAYNQNSGALGKYQFMPNTLNYLRDKYLLTNWISTSNFLASPSLQEEYMEKQIEDTIALLNSNNLMVYLRNKVTGSKRFPQITTSLNIYGLLAGAHLSGIGNLKKYFSFGFDPDDGQTSLTDYMAYFSSVLGNGSSIIPTIGLAFMLGIILYYK